MAGITDSAFRTLCSLYGADIVYSEMAHTSAIYYNSQKTYDLIKFSSIDSPYIVQFFGHNENHYAFAAKKIQKGIPCFDFPYNFKELSKRKNLLKNYKIIRDYYPKIPDGIDINFGCPAKKVFNHGSGVSLMKDYKQCRKIIESVTQNSKLPVSIKLRTGLETKEKFYDIIEFLENIKVNKLGLSAIMIHGRTYKQGFSGNIDQDKIKAVKDLFDGPVIANGSIKSVQKAKEVLNYTETQGVGIATGVYGKPTIFSFLKSLKKEKQSLEYQQNLKEIFKTVTLHSILNYITKGEHGIVEMRKHLIWYFKGIKNIKPLRSRMVRVETLKDIYELLLSIEKSQRNSEFKPTPTSP